MLPVFHLFTKFKRLYFFLKIVLCYQNKLTTNINSFKRICATIMMHVHLCTVFIKENSVPQHLYVKISKYGFKYFQYNCNFHYLKSKFIKKLTGWEPRGSVCKTAVSSEACFHEFPKHESKWNSQADCVETQIWRN